MATPTASQPLSTPKHLLNTPRHLPSPRPGTATSSHRPSAGKSPAVKTPASLHGHGHQTSGISQPALTPVAAAGLHEDILGIKSPDPSILAALNTTGLTPLPATHDALLSASLSGGVSSVPRNPEVERAQNLRRVVDTLQGHTVGRGITRDGVEKVAQAQGFTTLWDGETLTIAGNKVDLEILFDATEKETVKDVVLKLNVLDVEESQLQKEASAILRRSLIQSDRTNGRREPWKDMLEFSQSLKRLSELDHINTTVNCFELIADLSTVLRRIWDEEKHRLSWRNDLQHLCRSNVGRSSFNDESIGLHLEYWRSRGQLDDQGESEKVGRWDGFITCESGEPFVMKPPQWLAPSVLFEVEDDEPSMTNDTTIPKPNFHSLRAAVTDTETDAMEVDQSETLDVRFVYKLGRPVYLPLGTAATMNVATPMLELDQSKALTYQQAIRSGNQSSQLLQGSQQTIAHRWSRAVDVFDNSGQQSTASHSYCLYSIPPDAPLWCYPVRELRFGHPRHLLEALPLLRQYAMVWDLLSNMVPVDSTIAQPQSIVGQQGNQRNPRDLATKIIKRNNRKPEQSKLHALLESSNNTRSTLLVDLSLDVVSDPKKVKIKVFVSITKDRAAWARSPFLRMEIGVGLNGILSVEYVSGISHQDDNKWRARLEKRLRVCEDIGILLEWLLREVSLSASNAVE